MAAGGAEGLVQGPGMSELFALVNLAVVVGIIYFAGRKGIKAMLATRSKDVEKKIIDAKTELEKMQRETARARSEIAEMAATREKFIEEIRDEGQKLYNSLVADAKAAAERILADAKLAAGAEIQSATFKVREEIVAKAIAQVVAGVQDGKSEALKVKLHEHLMEQFKAEAAQTRGVSGNG